ncbi:AraC family transcriptional regulator [Alkalitalea saponilacus]|uniref:Helix-turn-helix domain-containing protein n=1 Tax=Alkalitalea saponilacus TaxID=889453 RepID=A0A1T5EGL8_9BACT|nr:AraC family transcriptional regulator [Alkalitalea saponilacus]ASB48985.1 AraC family transcriptional regulator [Alkalitalea saponilacus]SKB83162.1 Helix-turn-helix domain-containing protein [Alkalitalea saponilacus]
MKESIHREITPLNEDDCFLVFDRERSLFTFPVHFHPEYEINFIANAQGGRRVVGDHIEEIDEYELVMVGPNLYHGWENYRNTGKQLLHEITIQFPKDIFEGPLMGKNILKPIRDLLQNAARGIAFSKETAKQAEPRLHNLTQKRGFDSFLEFQSLLYDLSISRNQKLLTNISFQHYSDFHNSERIEKIYNHVKANFNKKIMLEEAAQMLNMSVVSFSRLIKQRTGKSFIEFINEIRLGHATRLLIETNKSVSEICYECGFNNISNFNRTFKRKQGCTPSEFRVNFNGVKTVF